MKKTQEKLQRKKPVFDKSHENNNGNQNNNKERKGKERKCIIVENHDTLKMSIDF